MNVRYFENGELNDREILDGLRRAEDSYKNGNVLDTMDELQKIINAIKKYEKHEIR